ncbi:ceramide-1-phosphate transfer protein [Biomphalaria glabrata]|uniref:Glycolipid transfer protein domain-containing protein n=1 Tax=Biomphalaria glabrata TaxID=6526 RepID=A0A2C9LEY2_BIOGL|nr:ceramide-1-phosphate transfer protein-like [Biomphalaria glabrata]
MATFNKDKKHDFNLEIVLDSFKKCISEDQKVILLEYLSAYHELCRFFKLTGQIFSFVARDLEKKMKAIEYHLNSQHGNSYKTVQSMVAFEVQNKTALVKHPHAAGTRTLIRLHQALEFILAFMIRIREGDEHELMSKLAWEVYIETLYQHHGWFTRKLAALAVYMLPTKKQLIDVMCKHDYDRVMELVQQVVETGQPVYNMIQEVLKSNDLLHAL